MKASIVIPAYRPAELLKKCLQGIIDNTDLSDIEVIVVCNGSDYESAELVLSLGEPFSLYWNKQALGFTEATNIGFRLAKADYVIVLNTDTFILPQPKNDWLTRLISPFSDHAVGITGIAKQQGNIGEYFMFFCTAIRRKLFDEIGYLDLKFSPGYGEDLDFCFRAQQARYKLVSVDTLYLNHETGQNIGDFMVYHAGEGSFTNKEERIKFIENQNKVLKDKYGSSPN